MRTVLLLACCLASAVAAELLQNPTLHGDGAGWNLPAGVATVVDGRPHGSEGPVLRIASEVPGWHFATVWGIAVPNGASSLRLSARVRIDNLQLGQQDWDTPRLMVLFHDAGSTQLEQVGEVRIEPGDGWRDIAGVVAVPAAATSFAFGVGLHQCSGIMLVDRPSCRVAD